MDAFPACGLPLALCARSRHGERSGPPRTPPAHDIPNPIPKPPLRRANASGWWCIRSSPPVWSMGSEQCNASAPPRWRRGRNPRLLSRMGQFSVAMRRLWCIYLKNTTAYLRAVQKMVRQAEELSCPVHDNGLQLRACRTTRPLSHKSPT